MFELYLGGARSGKSALAQTQAESSGLAPWCLATAAALDDEMARRIARHRAERGTHWHTIEEPLRLAEALLATSTPDRCIVVDCLTLWVTNLLLCENAGAWEREKSALLNALPVLPGRVIFVSNETGHGVVPMDPLSRRFVDEAGWLHQALAARCDRVVWVVAGLPQILKGEAL